MLDAATDVSCGVVLFGDADEVVLTISMSSFLTVVVRCSVVVLKSAFSPTVVSKVACTSVAAADVFPTVS